MNKKFKVGVIGLGVGFHHFLTFFKNKNCRVKKVCDFDNKKKILFKKKYPDIIFTNNYFDLIKDKEIKIISIASYDNYHFDQIVDCIKANKNIFIEKPICLLPKELKIIKNLLTKKRNTISLNMVLRTTPLFIDIKKEIEEKKFGNVFYMEADYLWGRIYKLYEWRSEVKNYSLILGAAIHMIDLVLWILNSRPAYVTAYGNRKGAKNIKFDTFSLLILEFLDGTIVKISANAPSIHPHFHTLVIYGDKKSLFHNLSSTYNLEKSEKSYKINRVINKYPVKEMRYKIIEGFINHLKNKKNRLSVNKKEIFDVMEVCFAAQKSLKVKKRIKINY